MDVQLAGWLSNNECGGGGPWTMDLPELITAVLTHAGKGQVGRARANFQLSQPGKPPEVS